MPPVAWIFVWSGITVCAVMLLGSVATSIFFTIRGIEKDLAKLDKRVRPLIAEADAFTARLEKLSSELPRREDFTPASHSAD